MTEFIALLKVLAKALGIEWQFLAAQVEQESSWDATAVGDNGTSFGLGQIKLATAQQFHPDWDATELRDPEMNLLCMYDCLLNLERWSWPHVGHDYRWALVAYNWGPGRVLAHWTAGKKYDDLPDVVRGYVTQIYERAARIEKEQGAL